MALINSLHPYFSYSTYELYAKITLLFLSYTVSYIQVLLKIPGRMTIINITQPKYTIVRTDGLVDGGLTSESKGPGFDPNCYHMVVDMSQV